MILGFALVIIGIGLTALGIDQSDRRQGLAAVLISLLTPLGIGLALVGALLIFVPDFFESPLPNTVVEMP